jgi:hypothetical protein
MRDLFIILSDKTRAGIEYCLIMRTETLAAYIYLTMHAPVENFMSKEEKKSVNLLCCRDEM